jgi:hypothetical protein
MTSRENRTSPIANQFWFGIKPYIVNRSGRGISSLHCYDHAAGTLARMAVTSCGPHYLGSLHERQIAWFVVRD